MTKKQIEDLKLQLECADSAVIRAEKEANEAAAKYYEVVAELEKSRRLVAQRDAKIADLRRDATRLIAACELFPDLLNNPHEASMAAPTLRLFLNAARSRFE